MKKIRVGLVRGGRSGEHEVSLRSAESILKAIDQVDPAILAKPVRAAAVAIVEQAVKAKKAPPPPVQAYDDDIDDDDEEVA